MTSKKKRYNKPTYSPNNYLGRGTGTTGINMFSGGGPFGQPLDPTLVNYGSNNFSTPKPNFLSKIGGASGALGIVGQGLGILGGIKSLFDTEEKPVTTTPVNIPTTVLQRQAEEQTNPNINRAFYYGGKMKYPTGGELVNQVLPKNKTTETKSLQGFKDPTTGKTFYPVQGSTTNINRKDVWPFDTDDSGNVMYGTYMAPRTANGIAEQDYIPSTYTTDVNTNVTKSAYPSANLMRLAEGANPYKDRKQLADYNLMNKYPSNPMTNAPEQLSKLAYGGNLTEYSGPTHENGGVTLNSNAEVEGGETRGIENTPTEDYIFSDRLKTLDGKTTFAKRSKNINNKYSLRPWDSISNDAKERELTELMNEHELVRQVDQSKTALKQYKRGGKIQYGFGDFLSSPEGNAAGQGLGLIAKQIATSRIKPQTLSSLSYLDESKYAPNIQGIDFTPTNIDESLKAFDTGYKGYEHAAAESVDSPAAYLTRMNTIAASKASGKAGLTQDQANKDILRKLDVDRMNKDIEAGNVGRKLQVASANKDIARINVDIQQRNLDSKREKQNLGLQMISDWGTLLTGYSGDKQRQKNLDAYMAASGTDNYEIVKDPKTKQWKRAYKNNSTPVSVRNDKVINTSNLPSVDDPIKKVNKYSLYA